MIQTVFLDSDLHGIPSGAMTRGDQPKWVLHHRWYKADHMGYESLAEVVASRLLARSNFNTIAPHVRYTPVLLQVSGRQMTGCASDNFRESGTTLLTLERLHRSLKGVGLAAALGKISGAGEKVQYTTDFVQAATGLDNFGQYLGMLLQADAFFLNEDRHTQNIAILQDNQTRAYRLCPLFDFGLSLLSDIRSQSCYPLTEDVFESIRRVPARPFSADFDEQIEASITVCGANLQFHFSSQDIAAAMEGLDAIYPQAILARVRAVLREQCRRYAFLFS
nr:hypothetical protein [uncultured Agathobaculum sp.]